MQRLHHPPNLSIKTRSMLKLLLFPLAAFLFVTLACMPGPPMPPPPPLSIQLQGASHQVAAGSQSGFVLTVFDHTNNQPAADSEIVVRLEVGESGEEEIIFQGQADANGQVLINYTAPTFQQEPYAYFTIDASSDVGRTQYYHDIYLQSRYNVLVSTDKPVYQPGQTIHMRTLVLDSISMKAAQEEPLTLTVTDPRGNIIMEKGLTTSLYGVASTDLILDSQASQGDYTISTEMSGIINSRTVEVKPYTLPRFSIDFSSEASYYRPGDVVRGQISAEYFFGKPVAHGQVIIKGLAPEYLDSPDKYEVFEVQGQTDDAGLYTYEFTLPDHFSGELDNRTASVDLEIRVIDTTNHAENVEERILLAEQDLLIELIPESGQLHPYVENLVYIQTSTPDGKAASVEMMVTHQMKQFVHEETIATDEFGLATMTVTPERGEIVQVQIQWTDSAGQTAQRDFLLGTERNGLLLRPERSEAHPGELLNVELFAIDGEGVATLLLVRGGQTLDVYQVPISERYGSVAIPIHPNLMGTVELIAEVQITEPENGQTSSHRDQRLLLVNPAPIDVDVQLDAEVYRPGDSATLNIAASHASAENQSVPFQGVLGISIVDESVFALGAQDPAFARTYFLLAKELTAKRHGIRGFAPFGGETTPYRFNQPYAYAPTIENTTMLALQDRPTADIETLQAAQQNALFGLMGQELSIRKQPSSTTDMNTIARASHSHAGSLVGILFAMPIPGIVIHENRRRKQKMLFVVVVVVAGTMLWSACAAPAAAPSAGSSDAPAEEAAPFEDETTATRGGESQGTAAKPRLRQFFPETLYWMPEVETDEQGRVQLEVPIADSITTWRVSVLASDVDGNLGSAQVGLRVFQDFFIEPSLPRFLTEGDEIDVPISVFNYLDEAQEIRLNVAEAEWFELRDEAASELLFNVEANEVSAAYIPIRVVGFGHGDFEVTATGSAMSDRVLRQAQIVPDGYKQSEIINDQLADGPNLPRNEQDGYTVSYEVTLPDETIPGTGQATLKVFPGVSSQLIEGLEGMLRQPNGCFEQTSSINYPNVMILDYMKTTGQIDEHLQQQAERLVSQGYQRLLGFEVQNYPGAFSLWGSPPPQVMLTAYGLMQFSDMSEVSYVDPALLERIADYLFSEQNADGSWYPQGMTIESGLEHLDRGAFLSTAYVAWALSEAGYQGSASVRRAVDYLYGQVDTPVEPSSQSNSPLNSPLPTPRDNQASLDELDSYTLALLANALLSINERDIWAEQILSILHSRAQSRDEGQRYWPAGASTYMGGYGNMADIETTALVTMALLRSNQYADVVQPALDYLTGQRDAFGGYYATQTTVQVLKTLILAEDIAQRQTPTTITALVNGEEGQTIEMGGETAGESSQSQVKVLHFENLNPGLNTIELQVKSERTLPIQLVMDYYVPWSEVDPVALRGEGAPALQVDLFYKRQQLQVNETVDVLADVEVLADYSPSTLMAELGVPPGFTPVTADLDELVANTPVDRYELLGNRIVLYLSGISRGQSQPLRYRLLARTPGTVQTPASITYDYYTPELRDLERPQGLVVMP